MPRLLAASLFLIAAPVFAQADRDRYDLGRRAHAFEVAWDEKADDPAAKKRAVRVPVRGVPGPASADFKLTAEVVADGKVLFTRVIGVSRVEKLKDRLAAVQRAAADLPSPPKTIEQATFGLLVKTLSRLANN